MTASDGSQRLNSLPGNDFGARFQTPSFTVLVGRSKKPYYVNEFFLTTASPYFKQIRSLEPEESSKAITLPTELVATEIAFEKFLEYVYLGDYGLGDYALTYEKSFEEEMGMKLHAQVYVLAEKLLMRDLKGCALEKNDSYTAEEGKIPRKQEIVVIPTSGSAFGSAEASVEAKPAGTGFGAAAKPTSTRDRLRASRTHSGFISSSFYVSPAANTAATGGLFGGSSVTPASTEPTPSGSSEPSKSVTPTPTTRSKIRATCLAELVELIYGKTSDNFSESYTKAENNENTRDPMRVLIARFAASCLDEYKKESVFLKLLRGGGQFAEDLVLELAGVDKVRSDEKKRLP
ncbi:hypothetical protein RUND412_011601 [Rhizina undulata]